MNTFRERPILMNGESVIGIIDLRKTQTRRVVKGRIALDWLQPGMFSPRYVALPENYLSPYGYAGDLLWVRENCAIGINDDGELACDYFADGKRRVFEQTIYNEADRGWLTYINDGRRPSIFMPRWASRITLKITNVRVERLQEISLNDVKAEGIGPFTFAKGVLSDSPPDPRWKYIELWNSINAKRVYTWDSNPWIWVIEFKPIDQPAVNGD